MFAAGKTSHVIVSPLIAITLLFCTPLLAETTIDNPAFNQQITAPTPPAVDLNQGRKGKAKDASGMAIFGAVMAMSTCAMMMAQAQKMPEGPEKNMMMMQAMQQCAQAAQNMASSGDNEDQAQALTSQPTQMPTVAQASTIKTPEKPKNISPLSSTPNSNDSPSDPIEIPDVAEYVPPTDSGNEVDDGPELGLSPVEGVGPPLKVMESPKIEFDDSSKEQTSVNGTNMALGSLGGGSLADTVNSKLDVFSGQGGEGSGGGGRGGRGVASSDGAAGEGGAEGTKDFNLANLMGRFGLGDEEGGAGRNGGDIVQLPPGAGNRPQMNIFEFASFRYKKAANDENRVQQRILPAAHPDNRRASLN